jgi:hypothetical protein
MCLRGTCPWDVRELVVRVSISPNSLVVGVLSQFTRPEEVSMHPKMMIALASEVEGERQNERQKLQIRSDALANRRQASNGGPAASGLARRLVAGISLRPRLS